MPQSNPVYYCMYLLSFRSTIVQSLPFYTMNLLVYTVPFWLTKMITHFVWLLGPTQSSCLVDNIKRGKIAVTGKLSATNSSSYGHETNSFLHYAEVHS